MLKQYYFFINIFIFFCISMVNILYTHASPQKNSDFRLSDHFFTGLPLTHTGWTDYEGLINNTDLYTDSRVIFVSSSNGNDSSGVIYSTNDITFDTYGMFQPATSVQAFKTIATAYDNLRDGYADILLLKRGDNWNEQFDGGDLGAWSKSGKSAIAPIIFSSYGTGDRPKLISDLKDSALVISNASHVFFAGIYFYSSDWTAKTPGWNIGGASTNITFEDCRVDGHYKNVFQSSTAKTIAVRRCIFYHTESHDGQIYAAYLKGLLLEENLFAEPFDYDYPKEDRFGRILYLSGEGNEKLSGVIAVGNILYRSERGGFDARAGGDFYNNLLIQSNFTFGSNGGNEDTIQTGNIFNNLFTESSPNVGTATTLDVINIDSAQIYGNIWTHPGTPTEYTVAAITVLGGTDVHIARNQEYYNNTIYGYRGGSEIYGVFFVSQLEDVSGNSFHNNEIQMVTGATKVIQAIPTAIAGIKFTDNSYYCTTPESDWFYQGNLSEWISVSGETGATKTPITYKDPTRTVAKYNQSLGGTADSDAFIDAALLQSRHNWNSNYTATAAINYIREGFNKPVIK